MLFRSPLGFFDGTGKIDGEIQPVRQSGQLIVMRKMVEVLLLFEELCLDFATHGDVMGSEGYEPARTELQCLSVDLDATERSILGTLLNLQRKPRIGIAQFAHQKGWITTPVDEQFIDRERAHFVQGVSEIALQRGVRFKHLQGIGVDDERAVWRLLKCSAVSRVITLRFFLRAHSSRPNKYPERNSQHYEQCSQRYDGLIHSYPPPVTIEFEG